MNNKRLVVIAALIIISSMVLPFAMTDTPVEADSSSTDLISVTTASGNTVEVDVDSGSTKTATLYVVNQSSSSVLLKVSTANITDWVDITKTVSVNSSTSDVLLPKDYADKSIATVVISFTADPYCENTESVGSIIIKAIDLTSQDGAETEITVPLTVNVHSVFSTEGSYNKFFGVIPNTLMEPFNSVWFTVIATFVLWILATVIVSELIIPLFARLVGNRKTADEKNKLRTQLTKTITAIMIIVAINECLQIAGASAELNRFMGSVSWAFYVIFGALLAWQIYLFIVTAFLKGLAQGSDVEGMDMSLLPLFKMIGELVIGIAGCCAVLMAFGVDLAGIMVSAGVVSLGITLGAQNTLNQFFSGIVLLATRPFKTGDFVMINNTTYVVKRVKLMFTEFKNWDGDRIVTMPNNSVTSATILNLTKGNPWTRISVFIDVAYGSDIDLCKKCLVEGAKKHPHVISDGRVTPPSPRLTEFADSGITFKLAVWVDDYDNSSVYAGQIRELIYKELVDNNVEIPYNRLQVDILSDLSRENRNASD